MTDQATKHPFLWAFIVAPLRVKEALSDPIRLLHIIFQVGMVTGVAWLWTRSLTTSFGITGSYYVLYEFVVEPIARFLYHRGYHSICGEYWERGPREGEKFEHP